MALVHLLIVRKQLPVKQISALMSFKDDDAGEFNPSKLLIAGDGGIGQSGNMSGSLLLSMSSSSFSKLTAQQLQLQFNHVILESNIKTANNSLG